MQPQTELELKNNPYLWAQFEYQHNFKYWLSLASSGCGLKNTIARFIIEHGQGSTQQGRA